MTDNWYTHLMGAAQTILGQGHEPLAMGFIRTSKGMSIAPLDGIEKDAWAPALVAVVKEVQADAVAIVTAIWQVKVEEPTDDTWRDIRPSEHPLRESLCLFQVKERGQEVMIYEAPYEVDPEGKVVHHAAFRQRASEAWVGMFDPVWEALS